MQIAQFHTIEHVLHSQTHLVIIVGNQDVGLLFHRMKGALGSCSNNQFRCDTVMLEENSSGSTPTGGQGRCYQHGPFLVESIKGPNGAFLFSTQFNSKKTAGIKDAGR
ncbi:hypothetical protein [Chitinimonas naiadis]